MTNVEGHREWRVRILRVEVEPEPEPDIASLSGTEHLTRRRHARRVAQDTEANVRAKATELSTDLRKYADDVVRREATRIDVITDDAYLVAHDAEEEFLAAANAATQAAEGVAVEVTGPWPPHSFAEVTRGSGRGW